jgi:Cu/Ag efflux pump CusA
LPPRCDARGGPIGHLCAVFALSMLFIPQIGAEFMPKLDEGGVWVRATMPYTISFEESSKIVPQVRDFFARSRR